MLLTHYNWKSVAERGRHAATAQRSQESRGVARTRKSTGGSGGGVTGAFGFNSDIDGVEDDEEGTGEGGGLSCHISGSGSSSMEHLGSSGHEGGSMNMAYDNSICRLYVLLHNIEDIFPLLQEASVASCPNSEHQIGECRGRVADWLMEWLSE
jgi:hypothetical protein